MFIPLGMAIFAIFYFSRKDRKRIRSNHLYPPKPVAPKVFVQVVVKNGDVVRVTTQTPVE